jgi:hypothetical protein
MVHSLNLRLDNQKDEKINCAPGRLHELRSDTPLFHKRIEYSCFRAQVFMFTGYGYMGFSHRWLVSLIRGGDVQE